MKFNVIDLETWDRKDCYTHFMTVAKSTYTITVNLDITKLYKITKEKNYKFYSVFTWIVSRAVNNNKEFRMGFDENGNVGYWDTVSPDYSVLNEKTKNMDSLCTEYNAEFKTFYNNMTKDIELYKKEGKLTEHKPDFFIVSCLPWFTYTSFEVSNQSEMQFLFPMITWGKYEKQNDKVIMPFTIQVHHAVADGYHCSLLLNDINEVLENADRYIF